jgi:hypothetical protein
MTEHYARVGMTPSSLDFDEWLTSVRELAKPSLTDAHGGR